MTAQQGGFDVDECLVSAAIANGEGFLHALAAKEVIEFQHNEMEEAELPEWQKPSRGGDDDENDEQKGMFALEGAQYLGLSNQLRHVSMHFSKDDAIIRARTAELLRAVLGLMKACRKRREGGEELAAVWKLNIELTERVAVACETNSVKECSHARLRRKAETLDRRARILFWTTMMFIGAMAAQVAASLVNAWRK